MALTCSISVISWEMRASALSLRNSTCRCEIRTHIGEPLCIFASIYRFLSLTLKSFLWLVGVGYQRPVFEIIENVVDYLIPLAGQDFLPVGLEWTPIAVVGWLKVYSFLDGENGRDVSDIPLVLTLINFMAHKNSDKLSDLSWLRSDIFRIMDNSPLLSPD